MATAIGIIPNRPALRELWKGLQGEELTEAALAVVRSAIKEQLPQGKSMKHKLPRKLVEGVILAFAIAEEDTGDEASETVEVVEEGLVDETRVALPPKGVALASGKGHRANPARQAAKAKRTSKNKERRRTQEKKGGKESAIEVSAGTSMAVDSADTETPSMAFLRASEPLTVPLGDLEDLDLEGLILAQVEADQEDLRNAEEVRTKTEGLLQARDSAQETIEVAVAEIRRLDGELSGRGGAAGLNALLPGHPVRVGVSRRRSALNRAVVGLQTTCRQPGKRGASKIREGTATLRELIGADEGTPLTVTERREFFLDDEDENFHGEVAVTSSLLGVLFEKLTVPVELVAAREERDRQARRLDQISKKALDFQGNWAFDKPKPTEGNDPSLVAAKEHKVAVEGGNRTVRDTRGPRLVGEATRLRGVLAKKLPECLVREQKAAGEGPALEYILAASLARREPSEANKVREQDCRRTFGEAIEVAMIDPQRRESRQYQQALAAVEGLEVELKARLSKADSRVKAAELKAKENLPKRVAGWDKAKAAFDNFEGDHTGAKAALQRLQERVDFLTSLQERMRGWIGDFFLASEADQKETFAEVPLVTRTAHGVHSPLAARNKLVALATDLAGVTRGEKVASLTFSAPPGRGRLQGGQRFAVLKGALIVTTESGLSPNRAEALFESGEGVLKPTEGRFELSDSQALVLGLKGNWVLEQKRRRTQGRGRGGFRVTLGQVEGGARLGNNHEKKGGKKRRKSRR